MLEFWRQMSVIARDMCDPLEPRRKERKVVGIDPARGKDHSVRVTGTITGRRSGILILDDIETFPRSDMVEEMEKAQEDTVK